MSETQRIEESRLEYINSKPSICYERARIWRKSHKETEGEPTIIRRAKAFLASCKELPVNIYDGKLIVGTAESFRKTGILTPEFSWMWVDKKMDTFDKRPQDPYYMTKKQVDYVSKEIFPYWKGQSLEESFLEQLPKDTAKLTIDTGIIDNDFKWQQAVGEITPDYQDTLFAKGYNNIIKEAQEHLEKLEAGFFKNIEKMDFYKSLIKVITMDDYVDSLAIEISSHYL